MRHVALAFTSFYDVSLLFLLLIGTLRVFVCPLCSSWWFRRLVDGVLVFSFFFCAGFNPAFSKILTFICIFQIFFVPLHPQRFEDLPCPAPDVKPEHRAKRCAYILNFAFAIYYVFLRM